MEDEIEKIKNNLLKIQEEQKNNSLSEASLEELVNSVDLLEKMLANLIQENDKQ